MSKGNGMKFFVGAAIVAAAALYFGTRDAAADAVPAMAPAADSDCGGAVLSPTLQTSFALGEVSWPRGKFEPVLYFRSRESALACRGSSDWKVRPWTSRRGQ